MFFSSRSPDSEAHRAATGPAIAPVETLDPVGTAEPYPRFGGIRIDEVDLKQRIKRCGEIDCRC